MCALLTSPDDRTLFMYSRKDSSLISLSVKMKLMPLPCWPAVLYKPFRSSIRLAVLYELAKNRMHRMNIDLFIFILLFLLLSNQTKMTERQKRKMVCVCLWLYTVELNNVMWNSGHHHSAIVNHLFLSDSSSIPVAGKVQCITKILYTVCCFTPAWK